MTHAISHQPDDFPQALLAAYADGELDSQTRAKVEQWLNDHPESLAALADQQELGPGNIALWEQADPPEPSFMAWSVLRRCVDAGLQSTVAPSSSSPTTLTRHANEDKAWWAFGGLVIAGLAAAIGWIALRPTIEPTLPSSSRPAEIAARMESQTPPEVAPAPRAIKAVALAPTASEVLAIATDDDVVLERVPDTGEGWLPIGRHPVPEVLLLASFDEVQLHEADPSPAWPKGGPRIVHAPGDAPMIYAASNR